MGAFAKWLLDEEQKELFDQLWANLFALVFLGLSALVLWPMGKVVLAWRLTKGYWVFWFLLPATALLLLLFRRAFRVNADDKFDAYVISAAALSAFLQAGWSAFAALTVANVAEGVGAWVKVALYAVGFVSSYAAFGIVSAYYGGSIYKMINLPLAAASFVLFGLWPAAGRFLYGWFFDLF